MQGRDVSANAGDKWARDAERRDEGRLKEGRGTLKGGTRDGFLTEKENSPESDKGTRRRGDKETRIHLTGFFLTC
jgi:hypothetical protein